MRSVRFRFSVCLRVVIVCGAMLLCHVGCQPSDSNTLAPQRVPLPVHTIFPQRQDELWTTEVAYGKLMARQSTPLGFARPGIVLSVTSRETVKRGDVLATLQTPQLDAERQQLEVAMADARSSAANAERVQALQQQQAQLNAQLAAFRIVAPHDGTVVRCRVADGQPVTPGRVAIQLAAVGGLVVRAGLPAEMAQRIRADQPVWVQLEGETIACSLESVAASRQPGVSDVVLAFPDRVEERRQQIGDAVEIRFFAARTVPGCWLPLGALQQADGGDWSVLTVVDERIARVAVNVEQLESPWAFVRSAFDNTAVVVDGGHRVTEGQTVRPVDVTSAYRPPARQETSE